METHDEFSERIRREQQIDARVRLATQLRVDAIEFHEEMIVITIRASRGRRWKKNPILERVRRALLTFCRYAADSGFSAEEVSELLDEVRKGLGTPKWKSRDQG